jgi:hypothetical protein
MARPETPKLSAATTLSLIWASSSSLLQAVRLGSPGGDQISPVAGPGPGSRRISGGARSWAAAAAAQRPWQATPRPGGRSWAAPAAARASRALTSQAANPCPSSREHAGFQYAQVASITTRVTPTAPAGPTWPAATASSWRRSAPPPLRRPGVSGLGTRTPQTSSALPISRAATRWMISSRS